MRLVYDTGHAYHRSTRAGEVACAPGKAYKPRRPRPGEIRERRLYPCRVCYPARRSPLPKVGRRGRAKALRMRRAKAEASRRDGGKCVAPDRGVPGPCAGPLDPSHVKPAARGGTDDADNIATVCRRHHDWLEEHPREAVEVGLQVHAWDPPPGKSSTPGG